MCQLEGRTPPWTSDSGITGVAMTAALPPALVGSGEVKVRHGISLEQSKESLTVVMRVETAQGDPVMPLRVQVGRWRCRRRVGALLVVIGWAGFMVRTGLVVRFVNL